MHKLEKGTRIACLLSVLENSAHLFIGPLYNRCNNVAVLRFIPMRINSHLNVLP